MVHRLSQSFWIREDTFQELWIHMKAIPAPPPPPWLEVQGVVNGCGHRDTLTTSASVDSLWRTCKRGETGERVLHRTSLFFEIHSFLFCG